MKNAEKSLALCYAIEAAGASEVLTKCSVLASELHVEMKRLAELSERMKMFAAENYPPDEKGQVDFARVLIQAYAEEILNDEAMASAAISKATQATV